MLPSRARRWYRHLRLSYVRARIHSHVHPHIHSHHAHHTTPFPLACVQCTGKYDTLKNIPDPAKVVEVPKFKQVSLRGK